MFQNTISNIILEIWPMIIITVVILTSLRIMDIIINKKKIVLYKDLLILLFAIYIIGFTYSEKVYMKNIIKKLILKLNAHVN